MVPEGLIPLWERDILTKLGTTLVMGSFSAPRALQLLVATEKPIMASPTGTDQNLGEVPGEKHQQMTWTVLPGGFTDSPHLFGQALSRGLLDLCLGPNGKILQYVNDLLIWSPDEKNAHQHAIQVLNFLTERGYKVSWLRNRWSNQRSLTWEFRLHTGQGGCPLAEYKESSSFPPS